MCVCVCVWVECTLWSQAIIKAITSSLLIFSLLCFWKWRRQRLHRDLLLVCGVLFVTLLDFQFAPGFVLRSQQTSGCTESALNSMCFIPLKDACDAAKMQHVSVDWLFVVKLGRDLVGPLGGPRTRRRRDTNVFSNIEKVTWRRLSGLWSESHAGWKHSLTAACGICLANDWTGTSPLSHWACRTTESPEADTPTVCSSLQLCFSYPPIPDCSHFVSHPSPQPSCWLNIQCGQHSRLRD